MSKSNAIAIHFNISHFSCFLCLAVSINLPYLTLPCLSTDAGQPEELSRFSVVFDGIRQNDLHFALGQRKEISQDIDFVLKIIRANPNAFLKLEKTQLFQFPPQSLALHFVLVGNVENENPPASVPFFWLSDLEIVNLIFPGQLFPFFRKRNMHLFSLIFDINQSLPEKIVERAPIRFFSLPVFDFVSNFFQDHRKRFSRKPRRRTGNIKPAGQKQTSQNFPAQFFLFHISIYIKLHIYQYTKCQNPML